MAIKPFTHHVHRQRTLHRVVAMAMTAAILLPTMALAQSAGPSAENSLCSVLNTVNTLLNVASIAIVTIAIIFAGYQIAFAHKRITDVAPALIGGVLIGAAAQIAKMVIGGSSSNNTCGGTQINGVTVIMDHLHTAVQALQHYA